MSKKTVISNGVEWESLPITIPEDYMEHFDFVNFGATNGGMEEYCRKNFGSHQGLHFEIEEECVKTMEEKGISCVQADITNLTLPENCVDFVIATGTIEHLMNLESVKKMIEVSIIAAKDFIYLTWPWFDSDEYLKSLGLTLFPSTWDGHTTHVTISDLRNILDELSVEGTFMAWPLIPNSSSETISPIGAINPELGGTAEYGNLGPYKSKYGPKPMVNFTEPVYYESVCFISLRDSQKSRQSLEVIKQFNWDTV